MTKVTLLGDSIRMLGYGRIVPELLGEQFEVYQPTENCRFSKYTLRGLYDWERFMAGSKVIHWNNGLWDICKLFGSEVFTSETEYVENMMKIADILLKRYEKVIFATTTPVTPYNKLCKNPEIERYNELIVPLLQEKGIIINDLHKLVSSDISKYISQEDHIHLSEEGVKVCAEQVADVIRKACQSLDTNDENIKYSFTDDTASNGAPV